MYPYKGRVLQFPPHLATLQPVIFGSLSGTKLCTIMMYNPAPMGLDRCHIIKYSGLSDSTYTEHKSLQATFCYCPHRCMTLRHSTITSPVMGFPSACTAVNHLHNTLSNCCNLGSFKVCWLVRPFTLLLKATNDHNWSLQFSVSQTVMI
jgi:hypothetical protein